MKIIIDGTPEEIAALMLSVQGRQKERRLRVSADGTLDEVIEEKRWIK
ncbi:MAG: hypothetical protein KH050_08675 [Clostridiaceae bacterium]|nr:hypothetical protein [Clostridiaceae bacterium]